MLLTGEEAYRHNGVVGDQVEDNQAGGEETEDGDRRALPEAPHCDGQASPAVGLETRSEVTAGNFFPARVWQADEKLK